MQQSPLFAPAALPPAVQPVPPTPALLGLAERLHARWGGRLRLGTSSWHFPGWVGQVWAEPVAAATLSREGLVAYAQHPLLRTVSLDRAFYRALDLPSARRLAAQVDADFRFVVKAPAAITDALLRHPDNGAALAPNPQFLDLDAALATCARPLAEGFGERLGVLVMQLSPLPAALLGEPQALLDRLQCLLEGLAPALPPSTRLALEVRDAALLTPALAGVLQRCGARYCLGLHDRMPEAEAQLPLLRALWPGDFVCRWNLQRGQRYADARDRWAPFDRLQSPDGATRATLVRVLRATLDAGHSAFVTINNKAEGSAPASVLALAEALDAEVQKR